MLKIRWFPSCPMAPLCSVCLEGVSIFASGKYCRPHSVCNGSGPERDGRPGGWSTGQGCRVQPLSLSMRELAMRCMREPDLTFALAVHLPKVLLISWRCRSSMRWGALMWSRFPWTQFVFCLQRYTAWYPYTHSHDTLGSPGRGWFRPSHNYDPPSP